LQYKKKTFGGAHADRKLRAPSSSSKLPNKPEYPDLKILGSNKIFIYLHSHCFDHQLTLRERAVTQASLLANHSAQ
jgi:hypothetical protein